MQGDRDIVMIKGKRSKRTRPSCPLELTMFTASSNSTSELGGGAGLSGGGSVSVEFSGYSDDSGELNQSSTDEEEYYMANCLILLSGGQSHTRTTTITTTTTTSELYRCKTCNKSFPSFQALGGHRSSHKKPNNKQMISLEERPPLSRIHKQESTLSFPLDLSNPANQRKCRVHECSLCGAEFASGQALGGHMRRHRPIPPPWPASRQKNLLSLDLNLPAQENDRADHPKFRPFATKEEVIVFSASSLIDCHY